ncbi:MAG TPA: KGG domain-containing protein [Candidatus Thermoplasmatota archaeon]|nr:KGG domain-containing protein [Candidatus Thermoplasmatota archaeon]
MAENEEENRRGFASMDEEEQREIASKGGEASGGNPENLENVDRSEAGRMGGEAVVDKYGPDHMAEIGKKGGENSRGRQNE